jgi:hypothetical protein
MANFDDEFESAPIASFDDEFEAAPTAQFDNEFDSAPSIEVADESSLPELLKTGAGSLLGLTAGEGTRQAGIKLADLAAEKLPGIAEDLSYRGVGGRTTSEGKKFYTDSLGKVTDPDMVNITPRSIGRQMLDENISGTFGLASPENQLINQRKVSELRREDKSNFLSKIDSPSSIDKEAILAEYKKLVAADKLDPAVELNRKIMSGLEKDASKFEGIQSILNNEESKAVLQSRAKYAESSKETARQILDKAQAQARRIASEEAVAAKLGQEGLDEFNALKQRSGNASVAEKIIAKNALTDGVSPGTVNKLSKFAGDLVMEKAPSVGAKAVDLLGKVSKKAGPFLKSGAGKALSVGGLVLGGMAGASAAENAGMKGMDVAASATAEAINLIPFTDASGAYIAGRQEYDRTGSLSGAAKTAASAYVKPIDNFGISQSNDARSRMEQNMKPNLNPTNKGNDFLDFVTKNPDSLRELAQTLQGPSATYAGPLLKAAEAEEGKRSAILYGLYQQPAFRSVIGSNMESAIPGVKNEEENN